MCLMNMHIFPSTDELHNDGEKFQILLCPLKLLKPKEKIKERESKKNGIKKILSSHLNNLNIKKMKH